MDEIKHPYTCGIRYILNYNIRTVSLAHFAARLSIGYVYTMKVLKVQPSPWLKHPTYCALVYFIHYYPV